MKKRLSFLAAIPVIWFSCVFLAFSAPHNYPKYAIKAGNILTVTKGIIQNGIVLVSQGKIEKVGKGIPIPLGYSVIDVTPAWLLPGFVDIHSHAGGEGYGDINDTVFQLNPEMRILDAIALNTPEHKLIIAAGVTTINHIPGSGANSSGTGVVMKLAGEDLDDIVLRFPGVMKIAQAGNPERPYTGEIGTGRMGMNWHLRELFKEVRAYYEECKAYESGKSLHKPKKSIRFEYAKEVFAYTLPVFVHCCWFEPVQEVFRMYHDEFHLAKVVITHGEFGAFRNGPAIAQRKVSYDCGPRLYDFEDGSFLGIITEYAKRGTKDISINTDALGAGEAGLSLQAAMAVRLGHDEQAALEGITINGARALGIDNRVGSIEQGKDADLVVWTGNPLDVRSRTLLVLVNGRIVYDAEKDGQRY